MASTKVKPIKLNRSDAPKFTISAVLDRFVMNATDLGENANKYYIIETQEGKGDYPYRIFTEYGRMGAPNPAKEGRHYHSLGEMLDDLDVLRKDKKKKYKDVELQDSASSSPVQVTVKGKSNTASELKAVNDKVLRFIGSLYQDATSYLLQSIKTPLGQLSANQVAKGLEVLHRIEQLLNSGITSGSEILRLTNDFYSYIPFKFGSKIDMDKVMINDFVKLNDRKDVLGVMSSVVQAQSTLEKTLEDKYKSLNIKLKELPSTEAEYKRLVDYVVKSQSRNHHFNLVVGDIFTVESMVGHDTFNPKQVSTLELFHGSRNENILSIMQSGLRIKPASAVHTGSMFGSGIYFADQSSKSANYCWGFNHADRNQSYYLFICEVATGKIKEYTNAQTHLTSAPPGYNSVMGKKGPSLLHNEIIVYKESQVKIKYIVEFKKR